MSTSWRKAGFSFVKYVDIASNALRSCVKESAMSKLEKRSSYYFKKFDFKDGVTSGMVEHDSAALKKD